MQRFIAPTVGLIVLLLAGTSYAHEGHDHGDVPKMAVQSGLPRGEAASDNFELVALAGSRQVIVYLDHFATNEPVENAQLSAETPEGPKTLSSRPDGSFILDAPWIKPGALDLIFTITSGATTDILPLTLTIPEAGERAGGETVIMGGIRWVPLMIVSGITFLLGVGLGGFARRRSSLATLLILFVAWPGRGLLAHEGEDHGTHAPPQSAQNANPTGDLAQRLPDGLVFVPKATQRILSVRTTVTAQDEFQKTVELPGRIIADPNASGVVQSSVGGRLSAPPGGFPRLGMKVSQGTILAYVTPPVQAIDKSDMRQRQGEIDQQIDIVGRRVDRYKELAPVGAISRSQLEEAQLELKGLKERRAALDQVRRDSEALIAPIDGVIAETSAIAGQMAAPGTAVFQVIDPGKLWIEALSFQAIAPEQNATALLDGRALSLIYRGAGLADRNQSFPIQYAIEGDRTGLRIGQFVRVQAQTGEKLSGIALPRSSIVRASNGQNIVYEHLSAERFQARPVRIEPLDAKRVLVLPGLPPGKRIVSQGAELLDQVR